MWEMVESPGNELDLPKRGHRIIGAEGRGRNLGSTRIGGHRKYIQQGDPKELVLEAKLKREFPEGRQVKQSVVSKPERQSCRRTAVTQGVHVGGILKDYFFASVM